MKKHRNINTYFKKYYVDSKQFEKIEKPEIAYILGLLWADGHIRKCSKNSYFIAITAIKEDLLNLLSNFKLTGNWSIIDKKSQSNKKPQIIISITDSIIGKILCNLGYLEKSKISACNVLSIIPNHLQKYWWNGFFDGDGCIHLQKGKYPTISFAGSYDQDWTFVINMLNKLSINFQIYRQINKTGKNSVVIFSGKNNTRKFYNLIYFENNISKLERKKEKFDLCLLKENDNQNRYLIFNDECKTLTEWVKITGINRKTISDRIDKCGWTIENALTTPIKKAKTITFKDKTQTIKDWAKELNIHRKTLEFRLENWSLEDALCPNKKINQYE